MYCKVTHNTLYTCCTLLVFEKFSPMMVRHQLVTGVAMFHDGHSVTERRGVIISVKKWFVRGSN